MQWSFWKSTVNSDTYFFPSLIIMNKIAKEILLVPSYIWLSRFLLLPWLRLGLTQFSKHVHLLILCPSNIWAYVQYFAADVMCNTYVAKLICLLGPFRQKIFLIWKGLTKFCNTQHSFFRYMQCVYFHLWFLVLSYKLTSVN